MRIGERMKTIMTGMKDVNDETTQRGRIIKFKIDNKNNKN
jgi:hypothetical protein